MGIQEKNTRVGFHSIESILENNPEQIKKVLLPANRNDKRLTQLKLLLDETGISYESSNKLKQEPKAILINSPELNLKDLKEFINNFKGSPLILILDNIIDPRNLGACVRSAAVTQVDAVIINKHQCAPINAIAHKVAAGGFEYTKIFNVTNLVNCFKFLTQSNIIINGLSEHASESYTSYDFKQPSALVMGSEEHGVRKKTLENCDNIINLSTNKLFKSLNVSVATGIILSEAARQRNKGLT
jgi:23S rRNA (guanosine2251-2'-O)-methyltransferase